MEVNPRREFLRFLAYSPIIGYCATGLVHAREEKLPETAGDAINVFQFEPVARRKIPKPVYNFIVGGGFAAMAGLATTAIAGRGNATVFGGNLTLNSVAAIVLGGVVLTGGVGSVIAVIPAGLILFFLNPILTAMGIDPHGAQVIQGVLIVAVMAVTGLLAWRRQRRS